MSKQRAEQLVEAAAWLEATGSHEGARKLYEQALQFDPDNVFARQGLERDRARTEPPPAHAEDTSRLHFHPGATDPLPRVRLDDTLPLFPGAEDLAPSPDPRPGASPPPEPAALTETMCFNPGAMSLTSAGATAEPPSAVWPPPLVWTPTGLLPGHDQPAPPAASSPPVPRTAWEAADGPAEDLDLVAPPPPGTMIGRDVLSVLSDAPPRPTPPPFRRHEDVRADVEALIAGARDLLELDDHSGAMELIEKAAQLSPDDPVVEGMKEKSELVLQAMFESKLGHLDARPRHLLGPHQIIWLNLDHRAGFVLAQIDGTVSYEDLVAICGMSRLDTLRILAQLVGAGAITTSRE